MKKIIALILLIRFICLANSYAQEHPNLIIIHTDEQNFKTLSCYRHLMDENEAYVWGKNLGVKTPNIDRIANEGAICMNYYASSPVCSPSRASKITGLYRQATGVLRNNMNLRQDVKTFAHILKENGYATSYVGKWHLEDAKNEKYIFNLEYNGGFDDNRYMMNGGHAPYFHISNQTPKPVKQNQITKYAEGELIHLTDYFTNKSLNILERDKDKPFCLMLSIPDPHTPDYAKPPYNTMYNHMDLKMPKTMRAEYVAQKPIWATQPAKNESKKFNADALRQYFGMVKHIDDRVGDILQFLDNNNLTDNTIILFTSDHGDLFFEHNRKNKNLPYESSIRIPFVIRYPKKIKAGKVIRKTYCNVDFTPTILQIMGISTNTKFHGEDTSNDFLNNKTKVKGNRFTHFSGSSDTWIAGVNHRYKLVLSKTDKPWLFDLKKDPTEVINFYMQPGYKKTSKQLMKALKKRMNKFNEPTLSPSANIIY